MSVEQLIEAVKQGSLDKVKDLIEAGVDVNQHGDEQEWTPLNYAAGKGDLGMVRLLVEQGKADLFKVGRDKRTPYKIALAACRVDVAEYLRDAEDRAGGDTDKISSREGENRPYCKAYPLEDLRRFPGWSESRINWTEKEDDDGGTETRGNTGEVSDNDIVFIHQDLSVTQSIWHGENVLFNKVTAAWIEFTKTDLNFKVPTDFDLIPKEDVSEQTGSESDP